MEYTLIRSQRKTAAIYIRAGAVQVRAPLQMPKQEIDDFVESKSRWIRAKLEASRKQAEQRAGFILKYGDMLVYQGRHYPIKPKAGNRVSFDGEAFWIPPDLTADEIKAACMSIYRLLAKRDLPRLVASLAPGMGVQPTAVKITAAKTRWGSCSAKGSLNFSWRLVMADAAVIEYVVVHELAHLVEMNHSDCFWRIVERQLPDYRQRLLQLRALQEVLAREDWD